jgi:hypothetical protein
MKYQLICSANYCGWESEIFVDFETADKIEKCPVCRVKRGPKFRLVELEDYAE